jgi:hypothetical protein
VVGARGHPIVHAGAGWCRKPKNRAAARFLLGPARLLPADSGGGLWEMGVGPLEGLGAMEPKMHKGGGC